MGYIERQALYSELEQRRNRPLITYVTSIRPGIGCMMACDAIPHIIEQIQTIPDDQRDIDFLIISNGGDPITSLRIVSILRERFDHITVVVPYVAYSAVTILALGADELLMHPYSNLGPVDPQLTVSKQANNGHTSKIDFSSEDIRNYIEFIRSDVGITDQAHLISAFNSLAAEVGPLPIGSAKRCQQLSLSLSTKMLETHTEDKNKAATIAKALNTSYYHHGYTVARTEAKNIGLNVISPEKDVGNLMWEIWLDFCAEMKCGNEFNLIAEIMADPVAKQKISNVPVVVLPSNTPPQIAQNIIGQMAQQQAQVSQQSALEINQLVASIESVHSACAVSTTFSILYWRNTNMALSVNATSFSNG